MTRVEFCCPQEITHPGSYHAFSPQTLLYLVFRYRRGSCKSGLGDGTWQTDCSGQTDRISPRTVTQVDKDITYRGRLVGGQGCTVKYIAHLFWHGDRVHDPQGQPKIYETRHRGDSAKMSTSCYAWDRKDKRSQTENKKKKKITFKKICKFCSIIIDIYSFMYRYMIFGWGFWDLPLIHCKKWFGLFVNLTCYFTSLWQTI